MQQVGGAAGEAGDGAVELAGETEGEEDVAGGGDAVYGTQEDEGNGRPTLIAVHHLRRYNRDNIHLCLRIAY